MPSRNRPRKEMTTVVPATRTLRPAVVTASTTAARGSPPEASAERKRVRTRSA
jgi:hypothetical protein